MLKLHFYKIILLISMICVTLIAVTTCLMPPAIRESASELKLATDSPPSEQTELIAYKTQLEEKGFIKLLHPETLIETTIYTSSNILQSPLLSPSGGSVSFGEWTGENNLFDFWVLNLDEFDIRKIAEDVQVESLVAQAKWSFDEKYLAYRASFNRLEPNETKLFVINATTIEVICAVPNVWAFEWSPVSHVIAYIPWQDQQVGISLVKVDECSSQSVLFFDDQLVTFTPTLSWSPDGKWIAFAGRTVQENLTEIVLANVASGEWKKLTNAATNGYTSREFHALEWSPDGETILFRSTYEKESSDTKTRNALFTVNVDTGQERKLAEQVSYPVWSPDSEFIAFVNEQDNEDDEQIHRAEISTGNIIMLSNTPGNKEFLSWK